jgi:hypothetical protein
VLGGAALALLLLTLGPSLERIAPLGTAPSATLKALPLGVQSLVARTLGRDQAGYAVHRSAGGLDTRNDAQGLSARFDARGVHVRSGDDTLALRFRAIGFGKGLRAVAPAPPTGRANRVFYRRGSVTEWYANGPLGLEQGFTLKARPAGARSGPLTLALSLSGSVRPALEPGAKSLRFADSALLYTGLASFDARGKRLPARLGLRGRTLLIRVDDRGARYPLRIDPFFQLAKLTASDGAASDYLGASVAISGDTIAVGAPGAVVSGVANTGAVYVFVKPAGGWANATQTAKLTESNILHQDDFLGQSVAISGDTIVAGAPGRGGRRGTVYVFVKPAGGWTNTTQTAQLYAFDDGSDEIRGERLGTSVAISGDTIAAGAEGWPFTFGFGAHFQGAVYVFVEPAGGWTSMTQTARLTRSNGNNYTYFGHSMAISGDTIVAAAFTNAAYVFVEPAGGWTDATETANLTPSDGAPRQVAISDDTIVTDGGYVFVEPAGGWTSGSETAKLTTSDGQGLLGAVAISGDTIVAGAGYLFLKPPDGWANGTEAAKLTASDGNYFGPLAISGDTVVAGGGGAAYVFRTPAVIRLTKQLVPASDPGRVDLRVGQTVVKAGAGEGDTGAVGVAPGTYRVSESAAAGTSLSGYASSIACTINGNPGPSAVGTSQVDVTVAEGDHAVCTITNKRKGQIALTKHLVPASDPGRFDLKVGQTVVKAAAGEGGSGSRLVGPGTYTLSELAAAGTSLSDYSSSIACTRNGGPGPSGSGTSLNVSVDWGDVLACTVTNRMGATITLRKDLRPSSDPGHFDLKVAGTVVKASAGNGGSGSIQLAAGTYRVAESAAAGTTLSTYATSIACTRNGNPGPSADGTTQLDVTVAVGDVLVCTLTNRHKAQVTLTKHLVPSSDPGRFDLKLSSSSQVKLVKTSAGDGDSGSVQVAPGTWTVLESAASGTTLSDYTSSIACTRNGNPGPSGSGTSLQVTLAPSDVLACTITNQRK